MENKPIACNLTDEEFRARRVLARQTILPLVVNYKHLKNGLHLQFSNTPKSLSNVQEFISLEQGCCGFLTFELSPETDPSSNLIELNVTGPDGVARFVNLFTQLIEDARDAESAA